MALLEKPTGSGKKGTEAPHPISIPQLDASAKPGCVMATVTVKITQMRRTVSPWPAGHPHTPVPTTPQSACPSTSCVMATMTVEMAQMRESSAVRPPDRSGEGGWVRSLAGDQRRWLRTSCVGRGLGAGKTHSGCRAGHTQSSYQQPVLSSDSSGLEAVPSTPHCYSILTPQTAL